MTGTRPILVTGAGGFVGSALARGLAARGRRVLALDRSFDNLACESLGAIPRIVCDLTSGMPDLPQPGVIVHAAALTTSPAQLDMTDAQHLAANLAMLMSVVALADRARPDAFVFLSSSGVFGPNDGEGGLVDILPPHAEGPYAGAKLAGEALVPAALAGVCATHVVRLGYLYGPDEIARPSRLRVSLVRAWLSDAEAGRPLVVPENDPVRDWTYAPDLAPALSRLIAGPGRAQPIHLCSPETVADSRLARMICERHPAAGIQRSAAQPTKAPMRPSRHVALDDFPWTPLSAGLDLMTGRMAA